MRRLVLGLPLILAGCVSSAPDQRAVAPGELPPIAENYRERILRWARRYYAEPRSLRDTAIADPVLIRDAKGRLLWLVCIEADARAVDGTPLGPRRQALAFAPNYMSAPLRRNGAALHPSDCDRPLAWRPWPALARL